ncbi:MAG: SRPBCC family protein [Gaiella sp.]
MATVEKSINVAVPVSTAYNQWTQFTEFPSFMDHVLEVQQLDDRHLHWVAEIGGERQEWDAEIVEQRPDRVIEWRGTGAKRNAGRVEFAGENGMTRVTLRMEYEPAGMKQRAGAALGLDAMGVEHDLERFKEMIESRGGETGAWRGEIHGGKAKPPLRDPLAEAESRNPLPPAAP